MTKELELLRWVLGQFDPVYQAGWGLHGTDTRCWHCKGCKAHATTKGFLGEGPPVKFPHAADCKYVAAQLLVDEQKTP